MSIKLIKEANNFYRLDLHSFSFLFSYETCVAYSALTDLYISENVWSQTTGKHLNLLNPDKSIRLPNEEFNSLLKQLETAFNNAF
jgi:hypothetical protein